ncbi:MAG: hypothetical protein P8X74_24090 [Reinekea sp.]
MCAGLVDGDLVVDAPVLVVEVSGLDASIALPEVLGRRERAATLLQAL